MKANFQILRYAQVWEDADILLQALEIKPQDTCLSIASSGDNALALLTAEPKQVIALDLNPSQIAALELKVAAFKQLKYQEVLEFLGLIASKQRILYYKRCQPLLSENTQKYWQKNSKALTQGFIGFGRFERYFAKFRKYILPLMHDKKTIDVLLQAKSLEQRIEFYDKKWNNWRWQLLFKVFFSRFVMGRLGRDPQFFQYVKENVADSILQRVRHALTELDPTINPYLHWILKGKYNPPILALAFRPENFTKIQDNLNRLEWHLQSMQDFLIQAADNSIDKFNFSDMFEYMDEKSYQAFLKQCIRVGSNKARLAYWNMLAPRFRPESLKNELLSLDTLAESLHKQDKAFFYSKFIIEVVVK